jgi:predicted metal-dependent HD superfamily phosphohydrolase
MSIVHFLLVYDRNLQRLVFERSYTNSAEAVHAYEAMEDHYKDDRHMEIVLVGADSIETIKLTHGNYFEAVPSASPYLAGV